MNYPMDNSTLTAELLTFSMVCANAQRLKIVGLMAQKAHTIDHLAALLNISSSTTLHYRSQPAMDGLVEATAE